MWMIFIIVVVIILTVVLYLATLDGNYRVKRSLKIQAPTDQVFATIVDFKSWPAWSPWLMHEPDSEIIYSNDYQDEGGNYTWQGKVVGAGKLTHVNIDHDKSINQQIEFIRPFKSINRVNWNFETLDNSTLVTWEMVGHMPFLFRFMVKKTEKMIGRDYELGLELLNGVVNAEAPHPQITFTGEESLDDFSYWAIPLIGNLRQFETARKTDTAALEEAADGQAGMALSLHHKLDPLQSHYNVEIAIPVSDNTAQSNYTRRDFKGGRYFKMTLRGDHRFLPLGWYALLSHCRMHKIKLDKARPSLEIYHDDPTKCEHSNQITTALYVAIK